MDRDKLWQYLVPMMEQDADYQQVLQRLNEAEVDYLVLLETMTPEKREVLQRYIAACEAMDDPLIFMAYQIGLHQRLLLEEKAFGGRRPPLQPPPTKYVIARSEATWQSPGTMFVRANCIGRCYQEIPTGLVALGMTF